MSFYNEMSEAEQFASRVIADHARSTAFAIADGILPGNEGRNYVLRKIMRRAIYHGREHLGLHEPFFHKVCDFVVGQMSGAFPELEIQREFIAKMVRLEEERFANTVTVGLSRLNDLGISVSTPKDDDLFLSLAKLYDTFGTPRDLIRVYLEEKGLGFEEDDFNARFDDALKDLQRRSGIGQTTRKSEISPVYAELLAKVRLNQFHGYDFTHLEDARVVAILVGDKPVDELIEGEQGSVVLDRTPFYAESGGQVGDTGILVGRASEPPAVAGGLPQNQGGLENDIKPPATAGGSDMRATVADTFSPVAGLIIHKVTVEKGVIKIGDTVTANVDVEKRDATRRNHTATHLVHAALKEVLGTHVKQAGSVVAPNYLRFDFTHYQPLKASEIGEAEDLVNRYILQNEPVTTNMMALEDAMRSGAVAMFGEKYGGEVRVLSVGGGEFSKELCGGTHVRATGDIGSFKITSDEAIASGVRRIRAITGFDAFERFREDERLIEDSLNALKTQRDNLPNAIARLQEELKKTRREMEDLKLKIATGSIGGAASNGDESREIGGVNVIGKIVDGLDGNGTRQLSDTLLARIKSGVVVLGRRDEGKVGIIVRVSADLTGKIKAGDIIREIVPIIGGRGGGKADMAEGGGTEPEKLADAIDASYDVIERILS
ncbi:MAG TPA: alanine--tRNA ligase-related protein [Pyrinomonadaceae bacterium]|nr:alanine--tRNA ligase-related protein [Pyrinomonadaceae bacterium]